jgi:hypothetical protein
MRGSSTRSEQERGKGLKEKIIMRRAEEQYERQVVSTTQNVITTGIGL